MRESRKDLRSLVIPQVIPMLSSFLVGHNVRESRITSLSRNYPPLLPNSLPRWDKRAPQDTSDCPSPLIRQVLLTLNKYTKRYLSNLQQMFGKHWPQERLLHFIMYTSSNIQFTLLHCQPYITRGGREIYTFHFYYEGKIRSSLYFCVKLFLLIFFITKQQDA